MLTWEGLETHPGVYPAFAHTCAFPMILKGVKQEARAKGRALARPTET